jgi:ribosomal protein S18 acetylase RimI-like enzyme
LNNPGEFRAVTTREVAAAYALYMEVVAWLKAKGVRQWLRPLDLADFEGRQSRGELFAYFEREAMSATVSLAHEQDHDWEKHVGAEPRWWLKTLAVASAHRGRDLGATVVAAAEAHLRSKGANEVWLECVDAGFLPDYYARLGYEVIKRARITYPSGNTFDVCVMRQNLR